MDMRTFPFQKILLALFVLAISFGIGWYGERAMESFLSNSKTTTGGEIQIP